MKRYLVFFTTTVLTVAMLLSLSSCFLIPSVDSVDWAILTVPEGGANKGDLVIVNKANAAEIPALEDQGSIAEVRAHHFPAIYGDSGLSTHMDKDALTALDKMLTDFQKAQESDAILIRYAYVPAEELGELPADHLTGLGCELKYVSTEEDGTTTVHDLSEDPLYAWLAENCHKYGFVVRYPADKAGKTGVSDYTDYFRYVGAPHAEYMKENGLCLEEYVELLKTYDRTAPLSIFADGNHYQLFYADVSKEPTAMYPAYHSYTYSGVGNGGIVVVLQD